MYTKLSMTVSKEIKDSFDVRATKLDGSPVYLTGVSGTVLERMLDRVIPKDEANVLKKTDKDNS